MTNQVYEVTLIVAVRAPSEYSAYLTVQNWLKEQQDRASDEIAIIHDIRVKENR